MGEKLVQINSAMGEKLVQIDSAMGEKCIHQDYFAIVFNYNVKIFQCCYKMIHHLFLCNMDVMHI